MLETRPEPAAPRSCPSGADRSFDVAVVGGGLVGASAALALRLGGLDVALIDAAAGGGPPRPIALASASQRALAALGAWHALAPRACPIERVHVSQAGAFGITVLEARAFGVEALGYVVSSADVEAALGRTADAAARGEVGDGAGGGDRAGGRGGGDGSGRLSVVRPAVVAEVDARAAGCALRLGPVTGSTGGEPPPAALHARLVVLADGGAPALQADLGVRRQVREFGQGAVVGRLSLAGGHDNTAYERFTEEGPLALLPCGPRELALVWTATPARVDALLEAEESDFLRALDAAMGGRLGPMKGVRGRAAFDLRAVRADPPTCPRAALVGNASQTLHPVAGQGFNLGLRDALVLAELCAAAARDGEDPGGPEVLARFASRRRVDRVLTTSFTDFLAHGFLPRAAPLRALRAGGLLALDLVPGLKRRFALRAMGYGPPAPRLVRGAKT